MPVLKNPKHEIFAQEYAKGKTQEEAALAAGYASTTAHAMAFRLLVNVGIAQRVTEIQEAIFQSQLVDARKLHRRWSEMFEADIADIVTEAGSFKPIKEWPKVWRQMLSGVDVKELFERSKDGGNASWDKIGEVVKLKFVGVKDLGELIGNHKAVDAFVSKKIEQNMHLHLHAEITDKLLSARKRLLPA